MYVCICNAVTEKQVRKALDSGVTSVHELKAELGIASNCGTCLDNVEALIDLGFGDEADGGLLAVAT